jgi:hypothetical protein
MVSVDLRRQFFVRWLSFVGVSGLGAELTMIAFILQMGVWGSDTSDLLLAEMALVAIVYGIVFGLAIFARYAPAIMFAPIALPSGGWRGNRWAIRIVAGLLPISVLLPLFFLTIELWTPLETTRTLVHLWPGYGFLVASLVDARRVLGVASPRPL